MDIDGSVSLGESGAVIDSWDKVFALMSPRLP